MNNDEIDLPKGIHKRHILPSSELGKLWDSIFIEEQLKKQLLSQAVLNFTVRKKVPRSVLPLHGVLLLVGPPGTGKTSLAKGLAHKVAEVFKPNDFCLLEVEPHSLTSSAMGKTQRAVSELFSQSIAESAVNGPTIVLLDEVETLAADRSKMSLEANPIDIHRATDAVLVQLDMLAERYPDLLFVATSNFPQAVDLAFTSRCDLVMNIPLPNQEACKHILNDCLSGLGVFYPNLKKLIKEPAFASCIIACDGLDGRAIRKSIANALASTPQTAINPNQVTVQQLLDAIQFSKDNRNQGDHHGDGN